MKDKLLFQAAWDILLSMRDNEIASYLRNMTDYHGFAKVRIPGDSFPQTSAIVEIGPNQVQAEIVRVDKDLSHEIHYHKRASAYVIVLGDWEGIPEPKNAKMFVNGEWKDIGKGFERFIPSGTPHGFTVNGGILYFLSVQSPPILNESGDDYHQVDLAAQ